MKKMMILLLPTIALCAGGCKKEDQTPTAEPAAPPKAAPPKAAPKAAPTAEPAATPAAAAKAPATIEGAKALLEQFLKPGADHAKLSKQLKPTSADYQAVFVSAEMAKKAEQVYAGLWGQIDQQPIKPKAGQTALLLSKATTDELKAGTGDAAKFPGGYKRAAAHLKPGLTVFRFKFVKPGKTLGMAFDGLYNVGGRWVLMPKPWRLMR